MKTIEYSRGEVVTVEASTVTVKEGSQLGATFFHDGKQVSGLKHWHCAASEFRAARYRFLADCALAS